MTAPSSDANSSVDVFQHPEMLPPDVEQLFSESEKEDIQLGTFWYRNLVNTVYPGNAGVRIYILRQGGHPVAALPILATKHALGWRVESLGNFYTSLYAPALAPGVMGRDVALLIRSVLEAHTPITSLRFAPMDPDSKAFQTLEVALKASGLLPFRFFCFGNWYLSVNRDWPSYLKNRSGALRNTIKRMTKKFETEGGTLEVISGGTELARGLEAYQRVYAASWKMAEPHPTFIPGLMQMCSARGWLRLGVAHLHGNPIAAQIWIVDNGKANIYKLAFDDRYRAYAPGTLLTAALMQRVLEMDGVSEVDYLIGDDPYKKSWMSHRRERWGIVAYNPKSIGGFFSLAREVLARSLKPWVTRFGTLMEDRQNSDHPTLPHADNGFRWGFFPAADFYRISEKWQSLCRHGIQSPLLSADFVEVSLRHFGRGDELICIAENQTGPVAATILRRKNGLVWETFHPSQMPLGPWLQLRQCDFSTLMQSLLRALPGPTMMLGVTELDPQFLPRPDAKALRTIDSITTGEIDLPDSSEHFKKSINSKPFNRRLRKAEKEIGSITLICDEGPEAISEYVNLYASMESRGWKGKTGTALSPNDEQSNFYVDLLRRFAENGRARMFTLKMGARKVAAQIAIVEDDVLYLLKTTYDSQLKALGPGVMLHYYITLHCYEQPTRIKRIEFYGPLNESQHMWITGTRAIYHANAYRSRLLATVHHLLINRQTRGPRAAVTDAIGTTER